MPESSKTLYVGLDVHKGSACAPDAQRRCRLELRTGHRRRDHSCTIPRMTRQGGCEPASRVGETRCRQVPEECASDGLVVTL
jgi:hypothetical protein